MSFDETSNEPEPVPEPTRFDTELTLSYKWAQYYNRPQSKLIYIIDPDKARTKENIKFYDPFDVAYNILESNNDIFNAFRELFQLISGFTKEDMIGLYLWINYYDEDNIPPNAPANMDEIIDIINRFFETSVDEIIEGTEDSEFEDDIESEEDEELITKTTEEGNFKSEKDLEEYYERWLSRYYAEIEQDGIILDRMNKVINSLQEHANRYKNDIPEISPIDFVGAVVEFRPSMIVNGERKGIELIDGLTIFAKSKPYRYLPYIQYIDSNKKNYYKLYTGNPRFERIVYSKDWEVEPDDSPNYMNIIPRSKPSYKDIIRTTLWLGDPENEKNVSLGNASVGSLYNINYRLDRNSIQINRPNNPNQLTDIDGIARRINNAFPNIDMGKYKEVKVRATFTIYDVEIDETTFLHDMLNNELLSTYIYIEESSRLQASKRRLDIKYRAAAIKGLKGKVKKSSINIILQQSYIDSTESTGSEVSSEEVDISTDIRQSSNHTRETSRPVVNINVISGASRELVEEFAYVLRVLFSVHLNNKNRIMGMYKQWGAYYNYIPGRTEEKEDVKSKTTQKMIKKAAPNIFVDRYDRICGVDKQPTIIPDSEVRKWESGTTSHRGKNIPQRVIRFPKGKNHTINLICPNPKYPHPGLFRNRSLNNKDEYPYLPCCYSNDHMSKGVNSYYNEFYRDIKHVGGSSASGKKVTDKILEPGEVAVLPIAVSDVLSYYRTIGKEKRISKKVSKMMRYGITRDTNSIIHCVCNAIDDPNYQLDDDKYVEEIRTAISNITKPELYKQELYDLSNDIIKGLLRDQTVFLDPLLFFRGIEEYFKINLYIFTGPKVGDKGNGELGIPRNCKFHIQPLYLDRPTVVVLRHWGSESDALYYPHCELIVDYKVDRSDKYAIKLFGKDMTRTIHQIFEMSQRTITWSVGGPVSHIINEARQVKPYLNMYSSINFHEMMTQGIDKNDTSIINQYIDDKGKARAFTFRVEYSNKSSRQNINITIITLPTPPENAPSMKVVNGRINFAHPNLDQVLNIFHDKPTSKDVDDHNRIIGLWFRLLDIKEGFYVPIKAIKASSLKLDIEIGGSNPIDRPDDKPLVLRSHNLRRTLYLMISVIKWVYEVYKINNDNPTPRDFIHKYVLVDTEEVNDSTMYYNFDKLPRILPPINGYDTNSAIKYIGTVSVGLVHSNKHSNKLVMYNLNFHEKMIDMIKKYHMTSMGLSAEGRVVINNYYQRSIDFDYQRGIKVFIGRDDINMFLTEINMKNNKLYQINRTLDITASLPLEPILYMHSENRVYLIQNVVGGDIERVYTLIKEWISRNVNLGPRVEPSNEIPNHFIYGISPTGKIVPIKDNTNGAPVYSEIIQYTPGTLSSFGRYGALLPLMQF